MMENKTADIKLQIKRKGNNAEVSPDANTSWPAQPQNQNNHETQLKASRDVRWQLCYCVHLVMLYRVISLYIILQGRTEMP